jgi:hypothetical protein
MNDFMKGRNHKVDIAEGASAKLPKNIFNFWPYGQLRAVRTNYESRATFELCFFMFSWAKKIN